MFVVLALAADARRYAAAGGTESHAMTGLLLTGENGCAQLAGRG